MRSSTIYPIFLYLLIFYSGAGGQSAPVTTRLPGPRDRNEVDLQRRMNDMRALDQKMRPGPRDLPEAPPEPKLTEEERARVLKMRHVDDADVAAYSALLAQDHTGIFKLFPDYGCTSQNVIRLAGECERNVPLSSAFTFRVNAYGDDIYHDIHFKDGRISNNSFFSQGIFTAVGNEPLESLGLTHPALRYLVSFRPDTDSRSAADSAQKFSAGIDAGGYHYADNISPQENTTYVMRVVAYRLENRLKPLSRKTTMNEMMFLSLSMDKRLDVIVVFRILGRDENDGLTIVWKELKRSDAAKIKFARNQALRDFRATRK